MIVTKFGITSLYRNARIEDYSDIKTMTGLERKDLMISLLPELSISIFAFGKMIFVLPTENLEVDEVKCSLSNVITCLEYNTISKLLFWNNFEIFSKIIAKKYKLEKITFTFASLKMALSISDIPEIWETYIKSEIN